MSAYNIGFAVGILLGLILVAIIITVKKKKRGKSEYDERQELIRGRGYKIAYFTLMISVGLVLCFSAGSGIPYIETDAAYVIAIMVSLVFFCIYCIIKDGYFGVFEKPKTVLIELFLIGLANFIIALVNSEKWVIDGKLSMGSINLICAITMLVVTLAGFIKLLIVKREDE